MQTIRRLGFLAVLLVPLTCACQHVESTARAAPSGVADISADELKHVLAGMARAHEQKTQLSWWVSAPLVGKPVENAFKSFYAKMGTQQGELLKDVQAWAKTHDVDLTYSFPAGVDGDAQKILEARQEKLVRGDSQADFERDNLMQMYDDYESQISEIMALLPKVHDVQLKSYLEKSLKVHEDGSAEIQALLRRFKFAA